MRDIERPEYLSCYGVYAHNPVTRGDFVVPYCHDQQFLAVVVYAHALDCIAVEVELPGVESYTVEVNLLSISEYNPSQPKSGKDTDSRLFR